MTRTSRFCSHSSDLAILAGLLLVLSSPSARADSLNLRSALGPDYLSESLSISRHFYKLDPLEKYSTYRNRVDQEEDYEPAKERTDWRWNLGYGATRLVSTPSATVPLVNDWSHEMKGGFGWEALSFIDLSLNVHYDLTPTQAYHGGGVSFGIAYVLPLARLDSADRAASRGVTDEEAELPYHKRHVSGFLHQQDLDVRESADRDPDGPTLTIRGRLTDVQHTKSPSRLSRSAVDGETVPIEVTEARKITQQVWSLGFELQWGRSSTVEIVADYHFYGGNIESFVEGLANLHAGVPGRDGFSAALYGLPHYRFWLSSHHLLGRQRLWTIGVGGGYSAYVSEPDQVAMDGEGKIGRFIGDHWQVALSGRYRKAGETQVVAGELGVTRFLW